MMGIKAESITYSCDGCGAEKVVQGSRDDGFRPHLGVPPGWENIPTKNHKYLTVCYDCFLKQDDVSILKVISFIDDCGHSVVIDVTDPRNRVSVYRDIISEGHIHSHKEQVESVLKEAEEALADSTTTNVRFLTIAADLINALSYVDLDGICSGRDGLAPFTPATSWK